MALDADNGHSVRLQMKSGRPKQFQGVTYAR